MGFEVRLHRAVFGVVLVFSSWSLSGLLDLNSSLYNDIKCVFIQYYEV